MFLCCLPLALAAATDEVLPRSCLCCATASAAVLERPPGVLASLLIEYLSCSPPEMLIKYSESHCLCAARSAAVPVEVPLFGLHPKLKETRLTRRALGPP
jgi:hypothetical protein